MHNGVKFVQKTGIKLDELNDLSVDLFRKNSVQALYKSTYN